MKAKIKDNKLSQKEAIVAEVVDFNTLPKVIEDYVEDIESNPLYSTTPDPEGKLGLNEDMIKFIENYVQTKNISLASNLAGITPQKGRAYYNNYIIANEIRRINQALVHRQFSTKMLNLTQVGGWLTSQITGKDVPVVDRLSPRERLSAAKLIVDINELQMRGFTSPQKVLDFSTIQDDVKDMSVDDIKKLISTTKGENALEEKEKIINAINSDGTLSPDDLSSLRASSIEELKDILNAINEEGNNNDQ